jgi:hypothetical protein
MEAKTFYISIKNIETLKKYNNTFFNQAVKYFLEQFEENNLLEICIVVDDKIDFKAKQLHIDKDNLIKIKKIALDNKLTLSSVCNYIIEKYDEFLLEKTK